MVMLKAPRPTDLNVHLPAAAGPAVLGLVAAGRKAALVPDPIVLLMANPNLAIRNVVR